jgi:hypothetical protein
MKKVSPGATGLVKLGISVLACAASCLPVAQGRSLYHLDAIQRDGYGVVELKQPIPNQFFIEASLNGHPIRLILDSGFCTRNITLSNPCAKWLRLAPVPVKDKSFGVSGKAGAPISRGTADSLAVGNLQVSGTTLDFTSLTALHGRTIGGLWVTDGSLSARRAVNLDADGFLGLGFLQRCSAIIDLPNRRLYLKPPGTGRMVNLGPVLKNYGFAEASFELTSGGLLVDGSINGMAVKMIIDTGAFLSSIDNRVAVDAHLKTYRSAPMRATDVTGVETEVEWADPTSFKLGGVETIRPKLAVQPTSFYRMSRGELAGLLGMDFLGQTWSIIDFSQHKLYFAGGAK